MRGRLMVGQQILDLSILVRIQAPQQSCEPFEGPKRLIFWKRFEKSKAVPVPDIELCSETKSIKLIAETAFFCFYIIGY